ncbi:spermidine/putrescine ABC transporter ATP-binding protein [Marinobacter lutaoensis]|jgi:spermidine/putrescine transport system ATP-binding protein|uniref:Spermidine/putrescine ABC transporter ATP-binding protein n=3 Tax=Marinobacter TaxID=2742 RepID=A0A1V2DWL2_9GAMM|nr:ABC transporter ATP-binding protein [Marinobacter lutaoensis]MBI41929.1 ABC transporter ATP-binding protein [Oceanospirillales bacterium]ONF44859.1 spermidine/putrescine ABC transporter ATP-binding protein [Marinobacter lutaoensis]|tara:strand:+ start:6957 stop:8051 length:1095 start_codon:yes stop_codon:yes gene_type:complete
MTQESDLSCQGLVRRFGAHTAVDHVSLDVPAGAFFSILGPSGCGKTTLLRLLAGFDRPDEGEIRIRGQRMNEVPPNRRPVNMVFQHLALFPTMTVGDNIAYGLKRQKVPAAERRRRVAEVLEQVGLPGLADRNPQELSGGQRQRVALARCLVLRPTLLLLDEPLGALDLKLREQMKVELKHLQKAFGTTFVYITHDQSEAMVMSDQVAVMRAGRFEQVASPEQLYREPATPFVAGFVGDNNRLSGELVGLDAGLADVRLPDGTRVRGRLAGEAPAKGAPVALFVRPEALVLAGEALRPDYATVRTEVRTTLFDGANSRVEVRHGDQTLYARLPQDGSAPRLTEGSTLYLAWDPALARVFALGEP